MANVFAWVFQIFFPMFKEYLLSKFKETRNGSKFIFHCVFYFALVWHLFIIVYLAEQASNNLELQKPIIQQYNVITKQNADMKNSLEKLQEDSNKVQIQLIQRTKELTTLQRKFNQPITTGDADEDTDYVYDQKTHAMVKVK